MHLCIFEDQHYSNFLPLVHFRPVYHLHCGALSLREKIELMLPRVKHLFTMRSELAETISEQFPLSVINTIPDDDIWFINGMVLGDENLSEFIQRNSRVEKVYCEGSTVAAAFIKREHARRTAERVRGNLFDEATFRGIPAEVSPFTLMEYPWDLVHQTAEEIQKDFRWFKKTKHNSGKVYPGAHLINKKNIVIGKGSVVKPGAVLDAGKGPIIIGTGVIIMPNAVIEGPAFVGNNSIIKIGAKIYHGTSIGKSCKVGGEVEASIIQSFTNKQHEGFLGHSYLGSWVNIGADTNTSDLKNNYSTIRVQLRGTIIDSGKQFVGLTMGDHSKSGINVMFDTGTVVGVSSNIYGSGLPPKYIPSFAWGGDKEFVTYDLEKSLETMKKVMARRNITMSASYEKLVRKIYEDTIGERRNAEIR